MSAPPAIARLRGWLTNPLVCLTLVLLTGVDAYLAKGSGAEDATIVGAIVHHPLGSGRERLPLDVVATAVVDEQGRVRVVTHHDSDDAPAVVAGGIADRQEVLGLYFFANGRSRGGWQYWAHEVHYRIDAPAVGPVWNDDARTEARREFVAQLVREGWVPDHLAETLATGSALESEFFWRGFAHDLEALALLAMTLWSVGLTLRERVVAKIPRRGIRLARGQCPACGYDLRGIESGVCPECGGKMEDRA